MNIFVCAIAMISTLVMFSPIAGAVSCTNSPLSRVPNIKHHSLPSGNISIQPINIEPPVERRPAVGHETMPAIPQNISKDLLPLWMKIAFHLI